MPCAACLLQGIVFSVRPPHKSWKNIANLSGGEKTLSSLSLVFALHHYKPTPLYVMDEIDAALGARALRCLAAHALSMLKCPQDMMHALPGCHAPSIARHVLFGAQFCHSAQMSLES